MNRNTPLAAPLQALAALAFIFLLQFVPQTARAADGDTTKVVTWVNDEYIWPVTHIQTFHGFPDSTKRFRKVIMRYTLGCASGGCDPWDVGAPVSIDHPVGNGQFETYEIARFITPYGKTGVWEFDVTDYQTLMRDSVTLRHSNASYTAGPQGFTVTIEFFFIEGTPPRYPYKVEKLWQGGFRYGINTVDSTDVLAVTTNMNGDTVYDHEYDYFIVYDSVISFDSSIVGNGVAPTAGPFPASSPEARTQMLWTAAELSSAGLSAGNITGLRFLANTAGSPLENVSIRMRNTALSFVSVTNFENAGFTEVYHQNTTLNNGWNTLAFTTPFLWNGTSNIVVDICYDNAAIGTDHVLAGDNTGQNRQVQFATTDYYMEFTDTNRVSAPGAAFSGIDSAITISLWQRGDFDEQPQNDNIFEGFNANGERVVNVHLPWGNRQIYWDCGNDGGSYDRINRPAAPDEYQEYWTHWTFVKDARTGTMEIYKNGQLWHSGTGFTRDMTGITQFHIGSNGSGGGNYYEGKIDEFTVWKTALSPATIQNWLYRRVDASHPNFSDLVLYYDFNDGAGATVSDAFGAHDGTVVGAQLWEGHGRIDACQWNPESASPMRPQVVFEQGVYTSHIDSILVDSSISLSIQTELRYNSFDSTVAPLNVLVDAGADATKLRIRTSGHGFGGNLNCAEFCNRWHYIDVDGNNFYQWRVWNSECGKNACYPQGGTWIYDRAGWCPGSFVLEEHLELTSLVAGQTHSIDYGADPYTWNGQGSTPTWQMANHLVYYEPPAHTLDVAIDDVIAPSKRFEHSRFNPICSKPKITLQNTGTDTLTSLDIVYRAGGGADSTFHWTGNLPYLQKFDVELGEVDWGGGTDFSVWVENPNGGTDQYATNDTFHTKFDLPAVFPNGILLLWRTNNQASETKYELKDIDGNTLFQSSPFLSGNTTYRDTFFLPRGCYRFRIYDTDKDGLSFFANNDGGGFARFVEVGGNVLHTFTPDFGTEIPLDFRIDTELSAEDLKEPEITLHPNPTTGLLQLGLQLDALQEVEVVVTNVVGKTVLRRSLGNVQQAQTQLDLGGAPSGMYFVNIRTGNGVFTRKVQISR